MLMASGASASLLDVFLKWVGLAGFLLALINVVLNLTADGRARRARERTKMREVLNDAHLELEQLDRILGTGNLRKVEDFPALLAVARWSIPQKTPPILDWNKHLPLHHEYLFEAGEGTHNHLQAVIQAQHVPAAQDPDRGQRLSLDSHTLRARFDALDQLIRDIDDWKGLFRMRRLARRLRSATQGR